LLNAAGVPAARVRRLDEALAEQQVTARGVLAPAETEPDSGRPLRVPVAAFGTDRDGPALPGLAPRLGEHSREVLREAGLGEPEIDALVADGTVLAG